MNEYKYETVRLNLLKDFKEPVPPQARMVRCSDWLQKQDSQEPKKLSLQNKNDIQFIIQTNADRKNFLLSAAEDEATVPNGIDEHSVEPKIVPIKKLRVENLNLECEWQSCGWSITDYEQFQKHVKNHHNDVHIIRDKDNVEYVCLWDVCGHKCSDHNEMLRHVNYHAYHTKLMAIGYNGRATLKLVRCNRDSTKRNQLPLLKNVHTCMWINCNAAFHSIQVFFDHVRQHTSYSPNNLCSWAGCGATFPRRVRLVMHVRSHTRERLIACYHCGKHFATNTKLSEHLLRQNVYPNSKYKCRMCGLTFANERLEQSHSRQHISAFACAMCDMSAPSPAALAHHVRYKHVNERHHKCTQCDHRSVTQSDLRRHMESHARKRNKIKKEDSDQEVSDEENSEYDVKRKIVPKRKYACHMCPEKDMKIFTRGNRLTAHLVKMHGAQWPFGHSRFRYQISKDGMYRLTTTRYEFEDVSNEIVDGYSGPKEPLATSFEFNLELKAEPTEHTPRRFEITFKTAKEETQSKIEEPRPQENAVEITMCDVDDEGNIINSKVINSDVVYT